MVWLGIQIGIGAMLGMYIGRGFLNLIKNTWFLNPTQIAIKRFEDKVNKAMEMHNKLNDVDL